MSGCQIDSRAFDDRSLISDVTRCKMLVQMKNMVKRATYGQLRTQSSTPNLETSTEGDACCVSIETSTPGSAMPAHNHFRLHIVIVEQYKEEAIEDMEGNLSVP